MDDAISGKRRYAVVNVWRPISKVRTYIYGEENIQNVVLFIFRGICIYIYIYVCKYVNVCIYICLYIYIYSYIYTYTYLYIYIYGFGAGRLPLLAQRFTKL